MSLFLDKPSPNVWFVHFPWIDGIVNKQCPSKRGRDGKWNHEERAALRNQLREAQRANEATLKAAGIKAAPHYRTEKAAKAFVRMVERKTGVKLEAVEGCYL
jgi:hypothetical protein